MAGVIDLYLAYRFLKNLVLPFEQWEAYKTGVIDKNGAILIPKNKRTSQQNYSLGYFDVIAMNLKKLLGKLPGGKSAIASYAAALLLLKEYNKVNEIKEETLSEDIDLEWLQAEFDSCMIEAQKMFEEDEAPTNNVGGGKIAGAIGDPPVKPKNKYKAQNEIDGKAIARRILGLSGVR